MKRLWGIVLMLACLLFSAHAAERGLTLPKITTADGENLELYQESHALIVGVSDYTNGWPDLPGVKKDVQAIQTVLQEHGFQIVTVTDPTFTELETAFRDFINQYGQAAENRLMFYFSGHGHTLKLTYGDEMGYIVPTDAPNPNQDETGFTTTALDMQMIEVYAKRIQSKHAIFLFDSCFSGSIFSLTRAAPENISYKTAQPVRQFLTSGSAEEQVPDESIFRKQFVAALQGDGDLNADGYVTGAELGQFLQDSVVNYSKGSQHPQYGKIRHPTLDKGDFVFQLPGAVTAEAAAIPTAAASSETQTQTVTHTADPESEMWELIKNSEDASDVEDFLAAFPDGNFAKVAQLKLKQLSRQVVQEQSRSSAPADTQQPAAEPTPQPPQQQTPDALKDSPQKPDRDEAFRKGEAPERRKIPEKREAPERGGLPKEIAVMQRLQERIVELKEELRRTAEKRHARQFEDHAYRVGDMFDRGIQEALNQLEPSLPQIRIIERLHELNEGLPLYIDNSVQLAEDGEWKALKAKLERQSSEMGMNLEEFQEQRKRPAFLVRALGQVRDDFLRLREILSQMAKQRDVAQFEPILREMEEVTHLDIEHALNIIMPPPSTEFALEMIHELREGLNECIDEVVELAWEDEWDELEDEWEPIWQDLFDHIEDTLEELKHPIR